MKEKHCDMSGACCDKIIIEIRIPPTDEEKEWWETRGCIVKDNYVLIPFVCPNIMAASGMDGKRKCWIYEKRPLICRLYPLPESVKKLKAFGIECSLI